MATLKLIIDEPDDLSKDQVCVVSFELEEREEKLFAHRRLIQLPLNHKTTSRKVRELVNWISEVMQDYQRALFTGMEAIATRQPPLSAATKKKRAQHLRRSCTEKLEEKGMRVYKAFCLDILGDQFTPVFRKLITQDHFAPRILVKSNFTVLPLGMLYEMNRSKSGKGLLKDRAKGFFLGERISIQYSYIAPRLVPSATFENNDNRRRRRRGNGLAFAYAHDSNVAEASDENDCFLKIQDRRLITIAHPGTRTRGAVDPVPHSADEIADLWEDAKIVHITSHTSEDQGLQLEFICSSVFVTPTDIQRGPNDSEVELAFLNSCFSANAGPDGRSFVDTLSKKYGHGLIMTMSPVLSALAVDFSITFYNNSFIHEMSIGDAFRHACESFFSQGDYSPLLYMICNVDLHRKLAEL